MDEAQPLGLQALAGKNLEDLRQSLGEVNEVEDAAVTEEESSGGGEIVEGEGQFLPGQGPAGLEGYPARSRGAEGRVGDDPLKVPFLKEGLEFPGIPVEYGAAVVETVAADILFCQAGEFGLEFDSPEPQGRPAVGEEEGYYAAAGAEIKDSFPSSRLNEGGEQYGVDAETVALARLGKAKSGYLFNCFVFSRLGRSLSGGVSISHSPKQYRPGIGAPSSSVCTFSKR